MAKQGRESMEAKEQLSATDEAGYFVLGATDKMFSDSSPVSDESAPDESVSDEAGYFVLGATDKMFSDSSPVSDESVSDLFVSGLSVSDESATDEAGYFVLGATDKMFSDSSPVSDESAPDLFVSGLSVSELPADATLASQPPMQEKVGQEKVGFVGERNGSLEVIRDGQRFSLHEGDAILMKDIVITGDASGAFLRFTNSKISPQTLRLDEEQRVVIEDFLAESTVAQFDAPNMNWQMSDGSLVLLPSNDDFAPGYGAGSARARLLQADSSGTDSSGTDSFGTDSSDTDSSASREGLLQSASSRASEYLAVGASESDYYSYYQSQDFSQENSLQEDLPQRNSLQEDSLQEDLLQEDLLQGDLPQGNSPQGDSPQEVARDFTAEAISDLVSPVFSQSSAPNSFEPSFPTAEELARLAQEQTRAQQAAEDQVRADQAAADQARAEQAVADRAAADQARAEQAVADRAAADQAAAEQAVADQAAADQAAAEQAVADQAAADRATAEQAVADQAAADQAAAEQAVADRAAADQAIEDQARAEQAVADRAAAEQAVADQAAADQAAADRATADQARAAAEQAAEEKDSSKDDGEAELEHFLLDNDADWSFDMTQTSSESWEPEPQQSTPEPLRSEPINAGYSLYEQNVEAVVIGAGETSLFT